MGLWFAAVGTPVHAELSLTGDGYEDWDGQLKSLGKRHGDVLKSIENATFPEQFKDLRKALGKHYPSYRAVMFCDASLRKLGNTDFAIGLIEPNASQGRIVALVYKNPGFEVFEIARFPASFDNTGAGIGVDMNVACASRTELARIKETYNHLPKDQPGGADFKAVGWFDAFCVARPGEGAPFTCYQYDAHNKKVVPIGGWNADP